VTLRHAKTPVGVMKMQTQYSRLLLQWNVAIFYTAILFCKGIMNKHFTAVVVLALAMLGTTAIVATIMLQQQSTNATFRFTTESGEAFHIHINPRSEKAPIAISGDNIYIAWPTNSTGNDEVTFRASTDSGATFSDKINLSNSTGAESQDVEIAADGDNVIVTWWERNQTAEEPVVRMSTDNGATFGPLLKLAANGTIGGEVG